MNGSVPDASLARLAELRRLIEAHETAIYLLECERDELRSKLRASAWTPPTVEPAA